MHEPAAEGTLAYLYGRAPGGPPVVTLRVAKSCSECGHAMPPGTEVIFVAVGDRNVPRHLRLEECAGRGDRLRREQHGFTGSGSAPAAAGAPPPAAAAGGSSPTPPPPAPPPQPPAAAAAAAAAAAVAARASSPPAAAAPPPQASKGGLEPPTDRREGGGAKGPPPAAAGEFVYVSAEEELTLRVRLPPRPPPAATGYAAAAGAGAPQLVAVAVAASLSKGPAEELGAAWDDAQPIRLEDGSVEVTRRVLRKVTFKVAGEGWADEQAAIDEYLADLVRKEAGLDR